MSSGDPFSPHLLWYQLYSGQNSLRLCPLGVSHKKIHETWLPGLVSFQPCPVLPWKHPFWRSTKTIRWPLNLSAGLIWTKRRKSSQAMSTLLLAPDGREKDCPPNPVLDPAADRDLTLRACNTLPRGMLKCYHPCVQVHFCNVGGKEREIGQPLGGWTWYLRKHFISL